jgi:tetratricopeptide (TPR) repeat protein
VSAASNSGGSRARRKSPGMAGGLIREQGRHAMKFALAAIGTFGTLVAFVATLSREGLRHWVQAHPYPIFIAFVATFLLALIIGNYARVLTGQYQRLELATRSREAARGKSAEAEALLELLAFFGPGPVAEDLLHQTENVRAPTEALQRILADPDYLRRAALELSHMSLAEIDQINKWIKVQRVAQESARGQLWMENPDAAHILRGLVQSILAASDPGAPDRDDTEQTYRQSRRHLIASGATLSPDPLVRQLIINQIRRLYRAGSFAEGVALGEPSLGYWKETYGSNDRQTLFLAVEVGSALRRLGRWKAAMELNLDTLGRLRSLFGTADQIYLLCARSYGIDLALLGDYAMALDNDLQLLPSYEQIFGRDHLDTLQLRNEIAISLRCLGRFAEALEYDRHTFVRRQEILGDEDTGTLTSRFSIARDLRMLGQIREAHEILAGISSVLGRKFIVSRQFQLLVEADLAVSLRRCGYYREALVKAEAVHRQYDVTFGPEHRETLRTDINVINDLRIAGRLLDARKLGQLVVTGWTSTAGADHPNTLAAQAAHACVLRAEGNPRAALRIDEHVALKLTDRFDEAHPSTLAVLTNMASDLAMMHELHRARQVGERSFQLHARTRGRDHPNTLATAANLSLDRRADGDHREADELHASTLRASERTLGVGHPDSRKIAQYERMTLDIEPMMD